MGIFVNGFNPNLVVNPLRRNISFSCRKVKKGLNMGFLSGPLVIHGNLIDVGVNLDEIIR